MIGSNKIGFYINSGCNYPDKKECFRPSKAYLEYPFSEISKQKNEVYESVREAIKLLDYDREKMETKEWNPFGDFITPGMTVLIKPNLVMDTNRAGKGEECLYTHPSVVAPIIDYVIVALKGDGKIIIGDAPVQECDFDNLLKKSGYKELIYYYLMKGIDISIIDFRGLVSSVKDGIYQSKINDKAEGILVNLMNDSEFSSLSEDIKERLRVTNYNPNNIVPHHKGQTNEYFISKYVLEADVIINMPKPKTHRIAGMTASLKNFVGANVRKEYLPHHTIGDNKNGGDESNANGIILRARSFFLDKKNVYEDHGDLLKTRMALNAVRLFSFLLKSDYRDGCWHGNTTISKTVTDINKIVYYSDKKGVLQETQQRKILIVSDMIISGEGNGPLNPEPIKVGAVLIGENPVCMDEAIAWIMGFDVKRIPTLVNSRKPINNRFKLVDADNRAFFVSNSIEFNGKYVDEMKGILYRFRPSSGWKNHIERDLG